MKSDIEILSFEFGPVNFSCLSHISISLLTTVHFSLFYAGNFTKVVYKIGYIFNYISLPYQKFFSDQNLRWRGRNFAK